MNCAPRQTPQCHGKYIEVFTFISLFCCIYLDFAVITTSRTFTFTQSSNQRTTRDRPRDSKIFTEAGAGTRDKHFTVMSAALISAVKIKMAPELCLFTSRQDDPYKQRFFWFSETDPKPASRGVQVYDFNYPRVLVRGPRLCY